MTKIFIDNDKKSVKCIYQRFYDSLKSVDNIRIGNITNDFLAFGTNKRNKRVAYS